MGHPLEDLPSPALVIDLDAARRNVARVLELSGRPDRWRPHVKTTKLPALWELLLEAGVRRFKCATPRELEHLARTLESHGSVAEAEVLVAYPHVGPTLDLVADTAADHPELRVGILVEDPDGARDLPVPLAPWIDLNPGMDRTGLPLEDEDRLAATLAAAGERLAGLSLYDGHLHQPDLAAREAAIHGLYDRVADVLDRHLGARMAGLELVSAGTPAFAHALRYEGFTALGLHHTVSPGTVVLHDGRSEEENPTLGLEPAAFVWSRIVSLPRQGRVTLDAGSKSLAAEAGDPCASVVEEPSWRALAPSEEHLPLEVPADASAARGRAVRLVPRHVCPTVNLHEEAVLMESGGPPRVVPVVARAHAPWV